MNVAANIAVALVAALHVWFLVLEMFLWQKPLGLRTFKNSPEKAASTAVLAANQGLYNGFLAAGLGVSFLVSNPALMFGFRLYCLSCVVIAGLYGSWTVSRKIFYVQALPAFVAVGLVLAR